MIHRREPAVGIEPTTAPYVAGATSRRLRFRRAGACGFSNSASVSPAGKRGHGSDETATEPQFALSGTEKSHGDRKRSRSARLKARARRAYHRVAAALGLGLACTAPDTVATAKDPHCFYPGDTIGVLIVFKGDSVAACNPLIAEKKECFARVVRPIQHTPCRVGQRTVGGAA